MGIRATTETHINLDRVVSDLMSDSVLKVGWVEAQRYDNGTFYAEAAATNEYGAPHKGIPPRPFMGPAVSENKNKWVELVKSGAGKAVIGDTTMSEVLDTVGAIAAGDVAKAIKAVTSPPLSPVTIAARLRKLKNKKVSESLTKPLIDTGIMLRSISYVVESK